MSNTIDNKVVALGFDNKQFESGTKQSMSTLDALKKSLNFDDTSRSLSHFGKGLNLSNISDGVQNISNRFSALGIIGITVLQNLTNSAINFSKKLFQSFTSPIKTGLAEYETQINAIQTILANTASKGTSLEQVNAALDTLNTYSDKTIYNFSEMAKNIGTFTAAGVDLQTSVDSIKGIANLAAVSGSTSQQAATAMYQLSQAISTGTVRLMDWNSVVNAGMGGEVFQEALKETARVNGVAVDEMIAKNGSFRESLQEGWLTSKILTETLAKFTGDLNAEQLRSMGYTEEQIAGIIKLGQTASDAATKIKTFSQLKESLMESLVSGWAQSWRIVIGDFTQARAFFTEVSDTIGPIIQASSDARNKMLTTWADLGGRTFVIEALRNVFQGLLSILKPIKEAFKEIFPKEMLDGIKLVILTANIKNFTERLKISGETADQVKRIFKGIFAAFDIVRDVVVSLVTSFFDLSSAIAPSGSSILEFLAKIGDYIVKFREGVDINKVFADSIIRLQTIFNTIKNSLSQFSDFIKEKFDAIRSTFSTTFQNVDTSNIESFFDKIKVRFAPFTSLFKGVGFLLGGFIKLAQKAAPVFFKLSAVIGNFLAGLGVAILEGLQNVDYTKVFDIINSGLIAAILLALKKFLDSGSGFISEATGIFGSITGILDGVRGSLEAWQQNLKAKTLLTIAGAIAILTASLLVLSTIDSAKLTKSLGVVTVMLVQLMGAMGVFSKVSGGLSGLGGLGASVGLVALATSIFIISAALSKLGKLDSKELDQGLGAITAISIGMVVLSKVMDKNAGSILSGSVGMIAFAVALLVIGRAVKQLGSLDPERLQNGLIGIGIVLAEVAIFTRLVDKIGVSKGAGLLLLAGSIMLISFAVEKFGEMDTAKMQQGLIAVGLILAGIAAFTQLTGSGASIIATAIGVTILGAAMLIFVEAITKLGNLDPGKLQNGLIGMGAALAIIAAAVQLLPKTLIITALGLVVLATALVILSKALTTMGDMTWEEIAKGLATMAGSLLILTIALYAMSGTLAGSAALLIAAAALAILTPVLTTLGNMGLAEIGLALLALAGVFALLAIAGYLLTPVIPTLLGLGVSMMLIGVAAMLVGVGLMLFSVGLSAIAVSGAAAALAIVAMISTILGIIPVIIKTLIDAIIIFGKGIIEATPVVRDAILALLLAVLDIIIKVTPKLLKALTILLEGLIQLIIDVVPDFIKAVIFLLTELLKEIAAKMPEFVQAGFDILIAFLTGIRDNIAEVVTVVSEIVVEFLTALGKELPDVIQAGVDFIIAFINGMADAIDKNTKPILDALGRLGTAMITALVTAIKAGAAAILKALGDIVAAAIAAIKKSLGLGGKDEDDLTGVGLTMGEAIVTGLEKYEETIIASIEDTTGKVVKGMNNALTALSDGFLLDNIDISPTIRPVIDLTDIISGTKEINKLMSNTGLNVIPTVSRVSFVMGSVPSNGQTTGQINTGSTISLTQINNSPKALSRIEIYRQTKNQLLTLKGLVKA